MIEKISENDPLVMKKAREAILRDRVICFRADTVYGFACNALSDDAVENLYALKKRDKNKPIAIFFNDFTMAEKIFEFDDFTKIFYKKYFPGKVTLVLKMKKNPDLKVSDKLNLESNFLGFRIIDGNFINDLISSLNFPLAVTSANISDSKELLSANQVEKSFENLNSDFLLIDGEKCQDKAVSTVVKIDNKNMEILRQGIVKID